jgi:hypothetical protein
MPVLVDVALRLGAQRRPVGIRQPGLARGLLDWSVMISSAPGVLYLLFALQPSVREQRPNAVWVQPQLVFQSIGSGRADLAGSDLYPLPAGLELGRQLNGHLLLSAGIAHLPLQFSARTQVTAGARWYFRDGALAPYLAAQLGVSHAQVDDTGGLTHTDFFAAAGLGAELVLSRGLSLMSDLQLGPENEGPLRDEPRIWHFSAWYRIGVGYRF